MKLRTPERTNGIQMLEKTLHFMNHRFDLESYLNPSQTLHEAVAKMADKSFLSSLIEKYFLKNENMVVVRQLMSEK